jgi:hypothetical protein
MRHSQEQHNIKLDSLCLQYLWSSSYSPASLPTSPVYIWECNCPVYKNRKSDLQPLVDVVVGRTTLFKVTLSAIPIHISIAVKVVPPVYCTIDGLCHTLIRTGTNKVTRGHCLVA